MPKKIVTHGTPKPGGRPSTGGQADAPKPEVSPIKK